MEKLHKLNILELSYNSLKLNISPSWNPPFQLSRLSLARLNLPHFPKWIQTQSLLAWLDLTCNGISDEVPKWLWGLSPSLRHLNLSHNKITGTIPTHFSFSYMGTLDVSHNKISGSVPLFPSNASYIDLSTNNFSGQISSICTHIQQLPDLFFLDLSNNQLSGQLPTCWEKMTSLVYLDLSNNSFSGEIPHSLGSLRNLRTLQLHGNNLSGHLPLNLRNCINLQMIDVGQNYLTGNLPAWIGVSYRIMSHLIFSHNQFYGGIPPEICSLVRIQVLDLSENNLSGNIPHCFNNYTLLIGKKNSATPDFIGIIFYFHSIYNGHLYGKINPEYALVQWRGQKKEYRNTLRLLKLIDLSSNKLVGNIPKTFSSLKGLISLNLSRNSLTGNLDSNIGDMEMLECLDLSSNQLSGEIPTSLAQLHYLAVLDLANKDLSGKIPSSTQLQSFNPSVYAGNNGLCGPPLALCPEDTSVRTLTNEGENMQEQYDGICSLSFEQEIGISMGFGFIVGFWGLMASLVLKKSWRTAYFDMLNGVDDWLYVTLAILLNIFKRS